MTDLSVHYSSKNENWNTPQNIIDLVVKFFGEIDLDPCADDAKRIPARVHYTKAEDGLSKEWRGNVFINPPYGREIVKWIDHGIHSPLANCLYLVPARPDTAWFQKLFNEGIICFIRGRLKFINPSLPSFRDDGNFKISPAPFPSVIALMVGVQEKWFSEVFGNIGNIVKRT